MNTVKNTLVILSAAATMLAAPLAHAATPVSFNSYQNDNEFLTGRNITRAQSGFSDPVTAAGGEEVEVAMYYHNTGGDQTTGVGTTAKNTTLKISMPDATTLTATHVIKGSITADNLAQAVTGTVVNGQEIGKPDLTITSGSDNLKTTMAFEPGSVRWYPDRMTQTGAGATLPNGQSGDSLITTGINIGDVQYCWQYSGYIHFKVKLTGTSPAILKVQKDVRKAGTSDQFADNVLANPGMKLEYSVKVSDIDGSNPAYNVRLQDSLPAGETYVGPTILHKADGSTVTLPDGITSAAGIKILDKLDPSTNVTVTFVVATATTIGNNDCKVNTVITSADNASSTQDTAEACFVVPSTPTPTPITTPPPTPPATTPKPTPSLPTTGPEDSIFPVALLSGSSFGALRYLNLKRKLKKSLRSLDIV